MVKKNDFCVTGAHKLKLGVSAFHQKTRGKPLALDMGRKSVAVSTALNPLSGLEGYGCPSDEVWLPQIPISG